MIWYACTLVDSSKSQHSTQICEKRNLCGPNVDQIILLTPCCWSCSSLIGVGCKYLTLFSVHRKGQLHIHLSWIIDLDLHVILYQLHCFLFSCSVLGSHERLFFKCKLLLLLLWLLMWLYSALTWACIVITNDVYYFKGVLNLFSCFKLLY